MTIFTIYHNIPFFTLNNLPTHGIYENYLINASFSFHFHIIKCIFHFFGSKNTVQKSITLFN